MKYRDALPITRGQAAAAFRSGEPQRINQALLSVTFHDPDWRWAQERSLDYLSHPDPAVRGLAATSLGHLARIHGRLDRRRVVRRLQELLEDQDVAGQAEDALDDIDQYLR